MTDLWVNDRPIEDYGVVVTRLAGWLDPPGRHFGETAIVPGRAGRWLSTQGAALEARTLTVGLLVQPATVAARRAALEALYLALQGRVELRYADATDRFVPALLQRVNGEPYPVAMLIPAARLELTFVAADPYAWARTAGVLALPVGTRVAVPMGSAPQGGVLRLMGAATNPARVILRDRAGNEIARMTLSTTWASTEYVEIDLDQGGTIKRYAAGVVTNFEDYLGATEVPLVLDPLDGPTLEVTGVAGGVYYHRARYLG